MEYYLINHNLKTSTCVYTTELNRYLSLVICLFPSLNPNEDHIIFHSAVVSLLLRTVVDILYKSNEFTVFPLSSDTPSLPDDSSEVKRNKSLEHLVTSELGIDLVLRQVLSLGAFTPLTALNSLVACTQSISL